MGRLPNPLSCERLVSDKVQQCLLFLDSDITKQVILHLFNTGIQNLYKIHVHEHCPFRLFLHFDICADIHVCSEVCDILAKRRTLPFFSRECFLVDIFSSVLCNS